MTTPRVIEKPRVCHVLNFSPPHTMKQFESGMLLMVNNSIVSPSKRLKCIYLLSLPTQFTILCRNSLAISPDGTSLAAAGFQTLRLFDCHHLGNQPLQVIPVHERNVTTMGFSHDGNWMFTGSEDMTAKVWDLRSNLLCCQRILQVVKSTFINLFFTHFLNE